MAGVAGADPSRGVASNGAETWPFPVKQQKDSQSRFSRSLHIFK